MRSLGLIKTSLLRDQQTYFMIKNLNKFAEKEYCTLYADNTLGAPLMIGCNVFHRVDAFKHHGPLITMEPECLRFLHNVQSTMEKYYYMWRPEWLYNAELTYDTFRDTFLSPEINYIARSDWHADLIRKHFGKEPKYIMTDWDHKVLEKIISNE